MCWFPKKNFAYKREAGAAGPPATGRRRGSVLNITAAVWTAGFHWWRSGNKKRTQNVSEYMLVLALCLVINFNASVVNRDNLWPTVYKIGIHNCLRTKYAILYFTTL